MVEAKNRHDEYFENNFQKILDEYNKKFKLNVKYKSNAELLKESLKNFGSENPESFIYINNKRVSLLFPEAFKDVKKFEFKKNKFNIKDETYKIETLNSYCKVRNKFLKEKSRFDNLIEFIKYIEDKLIEKYKKPNLFLRLIILESSYYNKRYFEGKLNIIIPEEEKEKLKLFIENIEKAVSELTIKEINKLLPEKSNGKKAKNKP